MKVIQLGGIMRNNLIIIMENRICIKQLLNESLFLEVIITILREMDNLVVEFMVEKMRRMLDIFLQN